LQLNNTIAQISALSSAVQDHAYKWSLACQSPVCRRSKYAMQV